jgi:Kef-type K+ transport system membrane component KefB
MDLLYTLLVLLAVTRLCGELAERARQPALVGELLGGILVGAVVHAFPDRFPTLGSLSEDPEFRAVTDLGVFFLMLLAGLEMHPRDLAQRSGMSLAVALGGLVIPLGLGFGLGWWFFPESPYRLAQALFLGTAVAITAVPVAIKILMDLGQLDSRVGKTIVAAALVDDILSLVLLSFLTALIDTGEAPDLTATLLLIGKMVGFFALTGFIGLYLLPKLGPIISRRAIGSEAELSLLTLVALGFAVLAELIHMHFIIGAFVAGLFFSARTLPDETFDAVQSKVSGLTKGLLAPIFFASIGLHLDLGAILAIPLFTGLLLFVAVAGKILGAGGVAVLFGLDTRDSARIGVAMSARGAVELIIAGIAMRAGLFSKPEPAPLVVEHLFSAVVVMAIVTTLLTPIALRLMMPRGGAETSAAPE